MDNIIKHLRLEDIKLAINESFKNMDYFLYEASKEYTDSLLSKYDELVEKGFSIDNRVRERIDKNYIMYKLDRLDIDEKSYYEFLIEYEITFPSTGIYFGCKAITNENYIEDQETLIHEVYKKHWSNLRTIITQRLGAMFADYPEAIIVQQTDNNDSGTYWAFWIRLNYPCDIINVAANSLKVIRLIYSRYLNHEYSEFEINLKQDFNLQDCIPRYTKEAYTALIEEGIKKYIHKQSKEKANPEQIFDVFLNYLQIERIVIKVPEYEYGYAVQIFHTDKLSGSGKSDESKHKSGRKIKKYEDFSNLIKTLIIFLNYYYCNSYSEEYPSISVPWTAIVRIFMKETYDAFKPENLKVPMSRQPKKKDENGHVIPLVVKDLYEMLNKEFPSDSNLQKILFT